MLTVNEPVHTYGEKHHNYISNTTHVRQGTHNSVAWVHWLILTATILNYNCCDPLKTKDVSMVMREKIRFTQ